MKYSWLVFLWVISFTGWTQSDTTYKAYKPDTKKVETFWDKTYLGGDIMLFGGSGTFYGNLSPMMGYRPKNKGFSVGIGATYQYMSLNYGYGVERLSWYGLRAFVRQDLFKTIFVHGEYENYFTKGYNYLTRKEQFIAIPCANVFVGYKQNFSDFSYYYFMLGYEVLGTQNANNYLIYPLYPFLFKAGYVIDLKGK